MGIWRREISLPLPDTAIPRAAKCSRRPWLRCEVCGDDFRRSLRLARGAAAAPGTAMKFLDDSAQGRIGVPNIARLDVVHNLVAVVVHLNLAVRTNHFVSLSHNRHPCLRASVQ